MMNVSKKISVKHRQLHSQVRSFPTRRSSDQAALRMINDYINKSRCILLKIELKQETFVASKMTNNSNTANKTVAPKKQQTPFVPSEDRVKYKGIYYNLSQFANKYCSGNTTKALKMINEDRDTYEIARGVIKKEKEEEKLNKQAKLREQEKVREQEKKREQIKLRNEARLREQEKAMAQQKKAKEKQVVETMMKHLNKQFEQPNKASQAIKSRREQFQELLNEAVSLKRQGMYTKAFQVYQEMHRTFIHGDYSELTAEDICTFFVAWGKVQYILNDYKGATVSYTCCFLVYDATPEDLTRNGRAMANELMHLGYSLYSDIRGNNNLISHAYRCTIDPYYNDHNASPFKKQLDALNKHEGDKRMIQAGYMFMLEKLEEKERKARAKSTNNNDYAPSYDRDYDEDYYQSKQEQLYNDGYDEDNEFYSDIC